MTSPASAQSLPFHEPPIQTILLHTGFLLLLNLVHHVLNQTLYCGLIGQVLLGILFGTPVSGWLSASFQTTVVELGYLGLILLVYEGGLNTSLRPLLNNLALSVCVALTGILVPIALSFAALIPLADASALQAFAGGAAMAATSLGTTFAILSSAGFAETRLGVVLTSAAMMDDVVGLVMIQVVAQLGSSGGKLSAESVARPVGASIGLMVAVVGVGWLAKKMFGKMEIKRGGWQLKWIAQTGVLIACLAAGAYAGASALFAAFLAGAGVSWWDAMRTENTEETNSRAGGSSDSTSNNNNTNDNTSPPRISGIEIYHKTYQQVVDRLLTPFFFASIGFSIPVRSMFAASTVWKGLIFSVLMFLAKFCTAIWLVRFRISIPGLGSSSSSSGGTGVMHNVKSTAGSKLQVIRRIASRLIHTSSSSSSSSSKSPEAPTTDGAAASNDPSEKSSAERVGGAGGGGALPSQPASPAPPTATTTTPSPPPPLSLYPSTILGLAMVARGEVAFLIASVAESEGIFSSATTSSGSELYLIIMWAAMLCTIVGPVGVGWLVKRVKKLEGVAGEAESEGDGEGEAGGREGGAATGTKKRRSRGDVLGVWGVCG